ncbi:UNVERIFIED_CONTAM: hypothetical protein PYX00_005533 [Menopon gallinae]
MEPDVSITVGESNLEKTINHVAKGVENNSSKVLERQVNGGVKSKIIKKKSVYGRKNHLKLPVNKNIKKKVAVLKHKNGKHMSQRNESFQYQGLQKNIKFKCYKCSVSDFTSISELQTHQRKCISSSQEFQSIHESTSSFSNPANPSNFKITRKVYLCSACGSYYENWNLFLHMKEMHNRHICLYCLGMFSQPDKLAQHLITKHNVVEQSLSSTEDFFKLYRGTCYLICCSCEGMFSEQEEFYEHSCAPYPLPEDSGVCPLCGLQGAHYPNCRRGFSDRRIDAGKQATLERRFYNKKKKLKTNKKSKDVFRIVNNENGGEMSVTVRKQTGEEGMNDRENSVMQKDSADATVTSPLRLSNEDLVSTKQYNEKMLQLYRPNKSTEKVISSIQSIEDSINRVVESLGACDGEDEDEDDEVEDEGDFDDKNDDANATANSSTGDVDVKTGAPSEVPDEAKSPAEPMQTPIEAKEESGEKASLEGAQAGFEGSVPAKKEDGLSDNDSTDSEKLTIAFDQPYDSANDRAEENKGEPDAYGEVKSDDVVPTAGAETPYVYITLKEDSTDGKALIKELVKESSWNCVYCAHAKRIAVNGKQLSLHILAEHRYVTCPEDSTEEEKTTSALSIVERLKDNLSRLENCYFNTDTFDSEDKSMWKPNDRIYECFHCLFATYVHKELYSHNRKMHQKAVFLCIMCKSNFYNYSELLCHLCPGIYIPGQVINPDITYRCFLCNVDPLPSSFRLMVHLRRRHNSCDICFDQSSNQFQLSTHVWKHKLSHMCYRCGIAYRNKPDITKHLFWKHGTESVLCKKCLQKKWPHVYHFCVPPNSFICDECSISLKSAVALKVHRRLHSGEYPYPCDKCEEKFISRKLLAKHVDKHNQVEVQEETPAAPEVEKEEPPAEDSKQEDAEMNGKKSEKKEKKSKKRKVLTDVFDLPPVNLSESDDSDQEVTEPKIVREKTPEPPEEPISNGFLNGELQEEEKEDSQTQIVDGVWNNFKNYMDRKEFPKTFRPTSPFKNMSLSRIKAIMLSDHDYHIIPNSNPADSNSKAEAEKAGENKAKVGLDHDYCNNNGNSKSSSKSKIKSKHKEDGSKSSSSESSSDSDSSCSCGSNCSCSSGSSSSTSSNDSDSDSREKRKERKKIPKEPKTVDKAEPDPTPDIDISVNDVPNENMIQESDLETEETETDEDFYDYNPAREANRILAEKRTQLLANLNGSDAFASSPSTPTEKPAAPKKKSKVKKRRSQSRVGATPKTNRKKLPAAAAAAAVASAAFKNSIPGPVAEVRLDATANGVYESTPQPLQPDDVAQNSEDAKRPKRKRVPLKFYGFSSDEESDTVPASRKREKGEHNTTTPAAPATPAADPPIENQWTPKSTLSWRVEKSDSAHPKVNPIKIRTSQTMKQNFAANNEVFSIKRPEKGSVQVNGSGTIAAAAATGTGQKGEKLYCFCQCPYDEVSEMIACDAEDCVIEWFHFECVGIMVPPKGSWYCPDCRKKLAAENEFMAPPLNDQTVN